MAIRNQLPPWHERMQLANGREVLIRPIRPEDAEPLRASFLLLEPDEVRNGFQSSANGLSSEDAARFAQPDPKTEFALVAAEPFAPGESLVSALVRARTLDNGTDAEFAVLVARNALNLGLGRHLLSRLARWARGRNLQRLVGDLPQENGPILDHADSLGFQRDANGQSGDLIRVVLEVGAEDEAAATQAH